MLNEFGFPPLSQEKLIEVLNFKEMKRAMAKKPEALESLKKLQAQYKEKSKLSKSEQFSLGLDKENEQTFVFKRLGYFAPESNKDKIVLSKGGEKVAYFLYYSQTEERKKHLLNSFINYLNPKESNKVKAKKKKERKRIKKAKRKNNGKK